MNEHINGNSNENSVTELEKKQLKKTIFNSIKKFNRKKRLAYIAVSTAAAVVAILSISAYLEFNVNSSEISDFVQSSDIKTLKNTDDVKIILNEGEDIKIDGKNTTISYSNSGSKVNVGNSKTLTQKTKVDEKTTYNTLVVPYGKRAELTLSDGSKVWLNSGSKFVYPVNFSEEKKRIVYLVEGEAAFDVAHNAQKPFVMMTDNQEIEVLGTVFNVSNYADDINNFVVLKSGSVQVSYPKKNTGFLSKKEKLVITPGTLANINNKTGAISSKKVNLDHYFSWQDGVLILQNSTLSDIAKRLSRYYNISITIEGDQLKNQTFSGQLDLKDTVEKVIETIKETTKLNYKITKQNVILTNIPN